jgi:hypothetical protein
MMQERIRAIAEDTGIWHKVYAIGGPVSVDDLQKFAQELIEECAGICYRSNLEDCDAHAMNLLYEFDINGTRNLK